MRRLRDLNSILESIKLYLNGLVLASYDTLLHVEYIVAIISLGPKTCLLCVHYLLATFVVFFYVKVFFFFFKLDFSCV